MVTLRAGAGGRSRRAAASVVARVVALLMVVRAALAPSAVRADDGPEGELVLLARTAPLTLRWAEVASLTRTVPAIVLAELDRARDPAHPVAAPPLFGEVPSGLPPAGWPLALPDAVVTLPPSAGGDAAGLVAAPGRRIAALWALGRFAITDDRLDLKVLELRVRYQDGLAMWINGLPVVRRGLAPGAPTLALAARLHGPEWETFYVPVVPGLLRRGDNLIAVEVRPAGRSPVPRLELEVVGRRGARIVVGPMVQRVGPTSAAIVVETDRPAAVGVAWGQARADEHPAAVTGDGRRHVAELSGLPRDARIRYQVTVDGAVVAAASFATAPRPGDVVRLAVYGDVRGGHANHAELIARMLADAPDLVLASGDLVARGTDEADWQRFFAVAGPLLATTPYYPALGNHDVGAGGDRGRRLGDRFALPPGPADRPAGAAWYSFDAGDVHVVVLDSNAYDQPAQRTWLDADLGAVAAGRVTFAITHDGPFSRGTHGGNADAARDYVPILARHHVAYLFSGHDHLYQRGVAAGLPYVVSGGGGAPLYPARCGVRHRPRCRGDDGMQAIASAHHYVLVTVDPAAIELCPRFADGTPLEPCVRTPR